MQEWIFKAALYCADCGLHHANRLIAAGVADNGDSDTFPQGPFNASEADSPQHCDRCGLFLENPLTDDGREYVKSVFTRWGANPTTDQWAKFYGIEAAHDAR